MNLKKLRISKQMSQHELAKRAGLAQSSISYIESGSKSPNIKTVIKLAKALEVNLECLLNS